MCEGEKKRTESEALFEEYLKSNGYQYEFEPCIPGRHKRPDYLLRWCRFQVFFEVKELHQKRPLPEQPTFIDPYKSLRGEIDEAREKFKEFEEAPCSLVVLNIDDWQASLRPLQVFGAMLGDLGFQMDFDTRRGVIVPGSERSAFLKRGKMVQPRTREPQNRTIAAIVVLERFRTRDPGFVRALEQERCRRESKVGRPLDGGEAFELHRQMLLRYPRAIGTVPRVVVHDNPFARIGLPEHILEGPYDERWVYENDKVKRVFCGKALEKQEAAERSEGLDGTEEPA